MSAEYQAVLWNRNKKLYDLTIAAGILVFLGLFVGIGVVTRPQTTLETLLIRGFGAGALLLLHVVLAIGPLCRLDTRFLPLLYNRRHLGVCVFLLALAHGGFSIVQFHGLGVLNPLVSVLASNGNYESLTQFPFQALGLAALAILFLLAATSHDFWLANLTAPVWKSLHMLVYIAYALVLVHVALGSLQALERPPALAVLLGIGFAGIASLHLAAGWRERAPTPAAAEDTAVDVCAASDIPLDRALIFVLSGERVAVFRYRANGGERIAAISNVCQHQNGPLGEGRVIDGCITCPWHGYQYRPEDGCSPPPFTETIPTFNVRVEDGRVLVDPRPNPPGTRSEPARVASAAGAGEPS
ncbi:MAG: Rieske (2Fe-2S) protein [Holophagales bacterium]|nr:Rieske (2Fe-2S) protein [Holophagales bacterium]MYF06264.1 Rieske (2Fe-2S) protein [Holophagales bacterium]MYJ25271.1 Rieske (2Fe-2S) protein [Holophagales bacterium]